MLSATARETALQSLVLRLEREKKLSPTRSLFAQLVQTHKNRYLGATECLGLAGSDSGIVYLQRIGGNGGGQSTSSSRHWVPPTQMGTLSVAAAQLQLFHSGTGRTYGPLPSGISFFGLGKKEIFVVEKRTVHVLSARNDPEVARFLGLKMEEERAAGGGHHAQHQAAGGYGPSYGAGGMDRSSSSFRTGVGVGEVDERRGYVRFSEINLKQREELTLKSARDAQFSDWSYRPEWYTEEMREDTSSSLARGRAPRPPAREEEVSSPGSRISERTSVLVQSGGASAAPSSSATVDESPRSPSTVADEDERLTRSYSTSEPTASSTTSSASTYDPEEPPPLPDMEDEAPPPVPVFAPGGEEGVAPGLPGPTVVGTVTDHTAAQRHVQDLLDGLSREERRGGEATPAGAAHGGLSGESLETSVDGPPDSWPDTDAARHALEILQGGRATEAAKARPSSREIPSSRSERAVPATSPHPVPRSSMSSTTSSTTTPPRPTPSSTITTSTSPTAPPQHSPVVRQPPPPAQQLPQHSQASTTRPRPAPADAESAGAGAGRGRVVEGDDSPAARHMQSVLDGGRAAHARGQAQLVTPEATTSSGEGVAPSRPPAPALRADGKRSSFRSQEQQEAILAAELERFNKLKAERVDKRPTAAPEPPPKRPAPRRDKGSGETTERGNDVGTGSMPSRDSDDARSPVLAATPRSPTTRTRVVGDRGVAATGATPRPSGGGERIGDGIENSDKIERRGGHGRTDMESPPRRSAPSPDLTGLTAAEIKALQGGILR